MAVAPSRPKGPPLNALRAFEAAARLGGFAAAAEELFVTPAAVAQQVKALEAWAGAPLFERRSQGVRLSEVGRAVLGDFTAAFDRLGEAAQKLRQKAKPDHVRIAALPSVAQLWLSPRLPRVRAALPGVTVSVTAMEAAPNLRREPFDLAVFYEPLPAASGSIVVCRDVIYPVCAPAVAGGIGSPADLVRARFIHDETWKDDWTRWLAEAAPGLTLDTSGPSFSLYALALEEARNEAGILIGHDALVGDLVAAGTLVAPFETRVRLDRALTIAASDAGLTSPRLRAIIDLLTGTA